MKDDAPVYMETGHPYDIRFIVQRQSADGRDKHFPVDAGFPQTITGQMDLAMVDEGTADFLYGLVRMLRPAMVLETGTNRGRSTQALAQALKANGSGLLLTFEPDETHKPSADRALQDLADYIRRYPVKSPEGLNGLYQEAHPDYETIDVVPKIELAFLDGSHDIKDVKGEIDWLVEHAADECWVCIDNTRDDGYPEKRDWMQHYTDHPRISFASLCGLDILWLKRAHAPGA